MLYLRDIEMTLLLPAKLPRMETFAKGYSAAKVHDDTGVLTLLGYTTTAIGLLNVAAVLQNSKEI